MVSDSDIRPKRPEDLSACRVLVTPTSFAKGNPDLKSILEKTVGEVIFNPSSRPLASAELAELLKDADGFIAGLDQIDASALAAAKRLKVIARYGVGVDRVDVAAATRRGIVVTNTPGANSAAVAELAVGLMLALCRYICQADQATRRGEWPRYAGIGLRGKTVGLVGYGAIGREVALRLKAFGCRLLASDPYVKPDTAAGCPVSLVPLDELLASSDVVSLHTAVTSANAGMVNAGFLHKMKQGALLINTARGELIDEAALRQALAEKHLAGAALDCFCKEPPGPDHPLLRMPQVIVTPHMGAHTDEAVNTMGRMSLDACLAVLGGERPAHIVNPEVYEQQRLVTK
ncbi:MAG: phosphoglycerate dehydrogenase [Desulfobacterales bacterium]|nr:MAG: phosphoglycerate dehydrogenase [Desulfobacterales bacterium]